MSSHLLSPSRKVSAFRITENPSLYGLVIREQGELVEYVSFREARKRHSASLRVKNAEKMAV